MEALRQPENRDIAKLFTLGAVWASAFMCVEVALRNFSPLAISTWRIAIATLVLLPIVWWKRDLWPRQPRNWLLIFLSGILYNAITFSLISCGQQFIPSSMAALLMSCGPFVALVLTHFLTHDEKFSLIKLLSVVLGFSGVILLLGSEALQGRASSLGGSWL